MTDGLKSAAATWNVVLTLLAAASLAYGNGTWAGIILAGMVTGAVVTLLAQQVVEAVVEVLPWMTAASGTLFTICYWLFRVMVWLES